MNVSDLRKGILRALDEARKEGDTRRHERDQAAASFDRFLETIALPLVLQAVDVLRAEKLECACESPKGSVRLVYGHAPQSTIEFVLDTSGPKPQVMGRTSLARGRQALAVNERPIAPDTPIDAITDGDVAEFLMTEIKRVVTRP